MNEAGTGGDSNVAFGEASSAQGANSVAIGNNASTEGANTVAQGVGALAKEANSVAIGGSAQATSNRAVAIGDSAKSSWYGVAIGARVEANPTSVAIGGGYNAAEAARTTMSHSVALGTYAKTTAAVDTAEATAEATVTANGTSLKFTGFAGSVKTILGGNAAVAETGAITMTNIGGTGKDTVEEAIKVAKTEVVAGKNVTVTPSTGANG